MTDNTNIGAERKFFEEWMMEDQGLDFTWNPQRNCYNEFSGHLAFNTWKFCRAALSNAEPVGYLVEWFGPEDIGCADLVFDMPDTDVAEGYDSIKPVFLHPSVLVPTEREKQIEDALRHIVERIDAWNKAVAKITGDNGHSWEDLEVARGLITNTGEQG